MDSNDEIYNKFIVTSDEEGGSTPKQPKTSKEQFLLISAFTTDNDETTTPKTVYDELWERLSVELNAIGPPVRNAMDWRRTWTVHKYNKRKATESGTTRNTNRSTMSSSTMSSSTMSISTTSSNTASSSTSTTLEPPTVVSSNQSDGASLSDCCSLLRLILQKLDMILESINKK